MKIRVTEVHPSPNGLVLGCVLEGPGGAWIRFVLAEVAYSQIPYSAVSEWVRAKNRELGDDEDEPLPLDFV